MEDNNFTNEAEEVSAEPQVEIDEELINQILEASAEGTDGRTDEDDAVSEYNDAASQYAELEEELQEAKDKYLRLFAEYHNYRKRTEKEKTET